MIKNQQTPTDIFKLWNTLHLEGWVCDDLNLTSGWRRKYFPSDSQYQYLSPMMDVVVADELKKQITLENDYSQEDVEKVAKWVSRFNE